MREGAGGVDDDIGPRGTLGVTRLRVESALGVLGGEATFLGQPLELRLPTSLGDDDEVIGVFTCRLDQERHVVDDHRVAFLTQNALKLELKASLHFRVDYRLQICPCGRIIEDNLAQRFPVECAMSIEHNGPKPCDDCLESVRSRLNRGFGEGVCV